MVQLGSTQWAMLDPSVEELLSLHCQERLVFHGSVKPASRSTHHFRNHETQSLHSGPTAQLLAWSGQARIIPTVDPTHSIEPVFHHHNAPTQVTSLRY